MRRTRGIRYINVCFCIRRPLLCPVELRALTERITGIRIFILSRRFNRASRLRSQGFSGHKSYPILRARIIKQTDEERRRDRKRTDSVNPWAPSNRSPMKHYRMWIGMAFWCGLLGVLWGLVGSQGRTAPATGRRYLSALWSYYTASRSLQLRLPVSCKLSAGDPVFAADAKGALQQVGIIVEAKARLPLGDGGTAQAVLFPSAPELSMPIQAYYFRSPDSLESVVETLLPPERRKQIEEELTAAFQEHQQEFLQVLQPVLNKSVREAWAILEQDLPGVLEKHHAELGTIAGKNREEILKRELIPLIRREVLPIVRKDSDPLVRQISSELWQRVSLWAFAWRGLLDRLPGLRGKHRLEEELGRFLEQEALPILARHEEDFLVVIETILRDLADDDQVKAAFRRSAAALAEDPELQRVLNDILHEVALQNPRFWKTVRQSLTSREAQDAMHLAGNRLEPTVRRVSDVVLGTREGLTPEFNRVLRQQILLKDRHGILLGDLPPSGPCLECTTLDAWLSDLKKGRPLYPQRDSPLFFVQAMRRSQPDQPGGTPVIISDLTLCVAGRTLSANASAGLSPVKSP